MLRNEREPAPALAAPSSPRRFVQHVSAPAANVLSTTALAELVSQLDDRVAGRQSSVAATCRRCLTDKLLSCILPVALEEADATLDAAAAALAAGGSVEQNRNGLRAIVAVARRAEWSPADVRTLLPPLDGAVDVLPAAKS